MQSNCSQLRTSAERTDGYMANTRLFLRYHHPSASSPAPAPSCPCSSASSNASFFRFPSSSKGFFSLSDRPFHRFEKSFLLIGPLAERRRRYIFRVIKTLGFGCSMSSLVVVLAVGGFGLRPGFATIGITTTGTSSITACDFGTWSVDLVGS